MDRVADFIRLLARRDGQDDEDDEDDDEAGNADANGDGDDEDNDDDDENDDNPAFWVPHHPGPHDTPPPAYDLTTAGGYSPRSGSPSGPVGSSIGS